jgi:hypothetical protein
MLRNPRAGIEELTWWLVERFPDDDELGAAFARVYSLMDLLLYNKAAALRSAKSDTCSSRWQPRYALAA